ncbi:hypothetical protein EW146_g2995 [Bondarzewia mesenterica]|uniref:Ribonuclease H n=1 Tax=Bondarzewia mesenterica TaxID=1095465 RepID=A0A4S4LYX7_9AGAM|nr:hypothetical protein EW146_g2995 [Bondarzewia mesenterica]
MPKPAFYAVKKGRVPGIYETWDECQVQVKGFSGPIFKKFHDLQSARDWIASDASTYPSKRQEFEVASPHSNVINPVTSSLVAVTAVKPNQGASMSIQSIMVEATNGERRTSNRGDEDVIYTDGACRGNGMVGSVAGVGVWWDHGDARNISERCPGTQTNNRAELIAIIRTLETVPISRKPLKIKTDSQYSIKCLQIRLSRHLCRPIHYKILALYSGIKEWLPNWVARNFISSTGEPVKNVQLIKYLAVLIDLRAKSGQKVSLQYVRGHMGEEGNEGADRLAVYGSSYPEAPDRDWDALRRDVEKRMRQMDQGAEEIGPTAPARSPVNVIAEMRTVTETGREARTQVFEATEEHIDPSVSYS